MDRSKHYRKRSIRKKYSQKKIIIALLEQGYSIDEIIHEYGFVRKYVMAQRSKLGMTRTRKRKSKDIEVECNTLEPELQGETLLRYNVVKSYRKLCLDRQIEWTTEGFYQFLSLQDKKNQDNKNQDKENKEIK